jgi:hypothetical protein
MRGDAVPPDFGPYRTSPAGVGCVDTVVFRIDVANTRLTAKRLHSVAFERLTSDLTTLAA